jgi:hypothetical protein
VIGARRPAVDPVGQAMSADVSVDAAADGAGGLRATHCD